MNLQEFAALKVDDKIENPMNPGSRGEVVEVNERGIRVVWGRRHAHETRFFYSVNSTAWMHWTRVAADAYPPRDCTAGPCTRDDCRRADQCLGGDYDKIVAGA